MATVFLQHFWQTNIVVSVSLRLLLNMVPLVRLHSLGLTSGNATRVSLWVSVLLAKLALITLASHTGANWSVIRGVSGSMITQEGGGALGGVLGSFNWYKVTSVSFNTELVRNWSLLSSPSRAPFPAQWSGSLRNVRINLRTSLNDTHLPTLFFSSSRTTLSLDGAFGVLVRMVIFGSSGSIASGVVTGTEGLVVAVGGACGHTT